MAQKSRKKEKRPEVETFSVHGFDHQGDSGDQWYGSCPFCGRDGKFYVNKTNGLWDCKSCPHKGNIQQFLRLIAERNKEQLEHKPGKMKSLSEERGLPAATLKRWELGWDGVRYTIPMRDIEGRVQNLRHRRPGAKLFATKTRPLQLFNGPELAEHPNARVFVCEGEWDTIALDYMLRRAKEKNFVVVGVPGNQSLQTTWVEYFRDRNVYVLMDNDKGGEDGDVFISKRLQTVTASLNFLHWPPDSPAGCDVRDYVVEARNKKKMKTYWNRLKANFYDGPRVPVEPDDEKPERVNVSKPGVVSAHSTKWKKAPTIDDVFATVTKWLELDGRTDMIEIVLATVLSQELDGDPVWVFIVGPPGGTKTELLVALDDDPKIYSTSSLTSKSLISGAPEIAGRDPSLIPKLDGLVLVVKDFTTILTGNRDEKAAIFGTLRDAFDGKAEKDFGTGVRRSYISKFTLIAAVTPMIDRESMSGMGERFIRYMVEDNVSQEALDAATLKAIKNVTHETDMRDELRDVFAAFLGDRRKNSKPAMSTDTWDLFTLALVNFVATVRGEVPRNLYRKDEIEGKPIQERATRLGKQFTKLGMALSMLRDPPVLDDHVRKVMAKTALDTIPQQREDVLRTLHGEERPVSRGIVARVLGYDNRTTGRLIDDLALLGVIRRSGQDTKKLWMLTHETRQQMDLIYAGGIERPQRSAIKKSKPGPQHGSQYKKRTKVRRKKK